MAIRSFDDSLAIVARVSIDTPAVRIPADLLPGDGRFGCGPSKIRPEALAALAHAGDTWMGTSHRQAPVKRVVASVRTGLASLLGAPDGWEIMLGNGGTTTLWDALTFGLIDSTSQHTVFGEFSSKFAEAVAAAPHLGAPQVIDAPYGSHAVPEGCPGVDLYALTHNETSTGVAVPIARPQGADATALVAVDATSAAGGLRVDLAEADVYYFAPQKCFASDGGLWLAACSPAAIERIGRIKGSGRWMPASLDLSIALDNSRKDQTYNTPALATLFLLDQQVRWINDRGGLEWAALRCDESASILYGWAGERSWATPFVANPAVRSHVVGTIDLDPAIDAAMVSNVLRANGVVDIDAYRKLGRNQIRVAMFPAIEPGDVAALCACVDWVVDALA
ncbi:MAG: phosphoserine transaminase [Acidimicrobiales bacterium]